jgi:hypothetical protein
MKSFVVFALLMSSVAHAGFSYYDLNATCGEVVKAKSGELLRRLEPGFFGVNDKYVLKTTFVKPIQINEILEKKDVPSNTGFSVSNEDAFTSFSDKEKFLHLRNGLKKAIKAADKKNIQLFACVGKLKVFPFKYSGSEVFWSEKSLDDAISQIRKKARIHL